MGRKGGKMSVILLIIGLTVIVGVGIFFLLRSAGQEGQQAGNESEISVYVFDCNWVNYLEKCRTDCNLFCSQRGLRITDTEKGEIASFGKTNGEFYCVCTPQ